MAADRDTEAHSTEVGVSEISKSCLRRRGNGEEVGAFAVFMEGLDGGASRPPYPGATMRKEGAARIDPTAIRVYIDVCWCFPITPRRHSFNWDPSFDVP